jgi:hypothetical protein
MRYSVSLPHSTGTYPVLIEYDGYASGSAPNLGRRWLDQGYAVMGLNVPGTGCSSGDDRVFDATVGAAGAYGRVMSSTYNARPLCAEVVLEAGTWRVTRERGSYDDLIRNERA